MQRRDFLKILGIAPLSPKLGLDVLAKKPWTPRVWHFPFLDDPRSGKKIPLIEYNWLTDNESWWITPGIDKHKFESDIQRSWGEGEDAPV